MSKLTIVCIGLFAAIVVMGVVLVCAATKPPAVDKAPAVAAKPIAVKPTVVIKAPAKPAEIQPKTRQWTAEFLEILNDNGSIESLEKHGWVLRFDHEAQLCIVDHYVWVYLTQRETGRGLLLSWIGNEMGKHNKQMEGKCKDNRFTAFSSVTGQSLGYVDDDYDVHIFR